jgi:hypothetical protein
VKHAILSCILITMSILSAPASAAAIEGFVFEDTDGSGSYDPLTDPLLPGWNITLTSLASGSTTTALTNGTGWYSFAGLDPLISYTVSEEVPEGWVNSTPSWEAPCITCGYEPPLIFHTFDDIDLVAKFPDSRIAFLTESKAGSGTLSGDFEISVQTPISVVRDSDQVAWENGRVYDFTVTYTGTGGTDTVTYAVTDGTFSRTVVYGPGTLQRPVTDLVIRARGANSSLPTFLFTSRTDIWNLTFTPAGGEPYVIPDCANPGDPNALWADQSQGRGIDILWVRTGALTGEDDLAGQGFSLTGKQRMEWTGVYPTRSNMAGTIRFGRPPCPGEERAVVSFGNCRVPPPAGNISGYALDAVTGAGIAGWEIALYDGDADTLVNITNTGSDGSYRFTDLPYGNYTVREIPVAGYEIVEPADNTHSVWIDSAGRDLTGLNFTSRQMTGTISGAKFSDLNGNGVQNINEGPLSGWTITLAFPDGSVVTTTTAPDGCYRFDNLPWGGYTVTEVQQTGWVQKLPSGGSYQVEINGTCLEAAGLDFGNMKKLVCCSCPVTAGFTYTRTGPLTCRFTDTAKGDVREWYWDFGDKSVSSERNPVHIFPAKGYYTVKEYVKTLRCDGTSYWASKSVRITVS